jgi:Flp pilus assembly pilin Flp
MGDEATGTAIEYALIVALISIASLAGYSLLGISLTSTFNAVANAL